MFGIKFAPAAAAGDAARHAARDSHSSRDHRFDHDELRHLLATAGGVTWGITSGQTAKRASRANDGCQPAA